MAPLPVFSHPLMKFGCIIDGHAFYTSAMVGRTYLMWLISCICMSASSDRRNHRDLFRFFNAISPPFPRLVPINHHASAQASHIYVVCKGMQRAQRSHETSSIHSGSLQRVTELVRLLHIINNLCLPQRSKSRVGRITPSVGPPSKNFCMVTEYIVLLMNVHTCTSYCYWRFASGRGL
ncbi:hypothetical protein CY34DRAFT_307785 [Suillus luteus UH-Slu-Lm8-n1]|uniref:Unplaced genomic scaffold CY34scaffold_2, whole genome shotgun sequence n=1 Tax=Suillus luteus UH-Slu-Lm8-n1 TaxID=930992 RepID=A0A0D0C2T5_9AGAM|nr:hypothetical protein CY34DRAFT_307785 [Suillus luteus UH-Slu-Lm8-n1]